MSYDIYLNDPISGETLQLDIPHQMKGGTYQVGGTTECHLNITYNYAPSYYKTLGDKGIRAIYGMTGAESIPILQKAIAQLGDDCDPNYWKHTEGNAKKPLLQLIALAQMRPDGVWDGDLSHGPKSVAQMYGIYFKELCHNYVSRYLVIWSMEIPSFLLIFKKLNPSIYKN